jgi:hypothetical protein
MFSKADLKTGYIVTFEAEDSKAFVLLDTPNGDIIVGNKKWFPLSSATDSDLFYSTQHHYSLKEVWRPRGNRMFNLSLPLPLNLDNYELMWERKEKTVHQLKIEQLEATIEKAAKEIQELKGM